MNNRGYLTFGVIISTLIFSVFYLMFSYGRIVSSSKVNSEFASVSSEFVNHVNSEERLYSLLNQNVSFENDVHYEDLNAKYTLKTLDETYNERTISNKKTFEVTNKTPIEIKVKATPVDNSFSYSYSLELIHDGRDFLEGSGINRKADFSYEVDSSEVYNSQTQEYNYGTYSIKTSGLSNVYLEVEVMYDELIERVISVKSDDSSREILVTKESDHLDIKYR